MKVKKELVVLDLESTGIWLEKDKIIEIALIKYNPDQTRETFQTRVNPEMKIPQKVCELTGISNEDVKDAPIFREVASKVQAFIGDADLAGFNVERFDLVLLRREFSEVGISFYWDRRKVYDAQKVFHINEKRDLSAAYQFYCGKELIGAHSALADTEATLEILEKQVEKYGDGSDSIAVLEQFEYAQHFDFYDDDKKFCWWNEKLYPMFGKYARKKTLEELVEYDPGYLKWVLQKDFTDSVKAVVRAALNGEKIQREATHE